jgi:hypothetical protein
MRYNQTRLVVFQKRVELRRVFRTDGGSCESSLSLFDGVLGLVVVLSAFLVGEVAGVDEKEESIGLLDGKEGEAGRGIKLLVLLLLWLSTRS